MISRARNLRAYDNAVVVAGDDAGRCAAIVSWLRVHEIPACVAADSDMLERVRMSPPRVVICQPGAASLALFHALQEADNPPVIVVLSNAPWARDEVYCNGRLLVVVVRMPVEVIPLATFIKAVLSSVERLDKARAAPAAGLPPEARPKGRAPLRVVH